MLSSLRSSSKVVPLERSRSLASEIRYPFYLLSLEDLLDLYGSDDDADAVVKMDAHQVLKSKGYLKEWTSIKSDSTILFISHEWAGWNHADPAGVQITTLCKVLRKLKDGKIKKTEYSPWHAYMLDRKYKTTKKEWQRMLDNAYVWVDWTSMPQPSAEKGRKPPLSTECLAALEKESSNAIYSIPAYIERSDFVVIIAPSCTHTKRCKPNTEKLVEMSYASWRRRGWCVLELFASYASRQKKHPLLLIDSGGRDPIWIPNFEAFRLSLGESDFTCCQRNHNFTDSRGKRVACDKPRCREILEAMLRKKAAHFFKTGHATEGRVTSCLIPWFVRGLPLRHEVGTGSSLKREETKETTAILGESRDDKLVLCNFKRRLKWCKSKDGEWYDRGGFSLLHYAIMEKDAAIRNCVLCWIGALSDEKERLKRLNCPPLQNYVHIGFPSKSHIAPINLAMMLGDTDAVTDLLGAGASAVSPFAETSPMTSALAVNYVDGVKYWLERFPKWDLSAGEGVLGGLPLGNAIWGGPYRLELVKYLLDQGCSVASPNKSGNNAIHSCAGNVDGSSDVMAILIDTLRKQGERDSSIDVRSIVNIQSRAISRKLRAFAWLGKILTRLGMAGSTSILKELWDDQGETALHKAVKKGKVDVVETLLVKGDADWTIKTDRGLDVADYLRMYGPYPAVESVLMSHMSKKRTAAASDK